jgi:uncharacterized LabA/DUF88 family protein
VAVEAVRVAAFVDGFNLYHAIDDLRTPHLKWLNLRGLCEAFAPTPEHQLTGVLYFSAFATWRRDSYGRQQAYVKALKAAGVTPIMGRFKPKDRGCRSCGATWQDHEEKETDVNVALQLLHWAHRDKFDLALLISGDSDLSPVVRLVRGEFPHKRIRILTPVGRNHSMELVTAAGGAEHARKIQRIHLERALLPASVKDRGGTVVAVRPREYDPPRGVVVAAYPATRRGAGRR